jgi:hypothetical protein
MNPHILMVLDHLANPDKYTQEHLKDNALAADDAAEYAPDDEVVVTALASHVSVCANAYYYYDDDEGDVEYWVDEYFLRSGENKDDYIMELTK